MRKKPITVYDGTRTLKFPSISAAAIHFGAPYSRSVRRITESGWSPEETFGIDKRPGRKVFHAKSITVRGVFYESILAAAVANGVNHQTARDRMSRGMHPDKAFTPTREKKPPEKRQSAIQVDVFGERFPSLATLSRYLDVSDGALKKNRKAGSVPSRKFLEKFVFPLKRAGLWDQDRDQRTDHAEAFEACKRPERR